jgi:hypothetical protein
MFRPLKKLMILSPKLIGEGSIIHISSSRARVYIICLLFLKKRRLDLLPVNTILATLDLSKWNSPMIYLNSLLFPSSSRFIIMLKYTIFFDSGKLIEK